MVNLLYIFATVVLTVYGQLIVKWQVSQAGALPESAADRALFFLKLLLNPWVISGIGAAFLAMICWMAAMTKFALNFAYPFMSLAFVLVLLLSGPLFHETITVPKVCGVLLIVIGVVVSSQG
jgi:multidrug transporter EmrE-like cation transporter